MIDFSKFFTAAHTHGDTPGPEPYPWQATLANRLATAAPPKAIVVPTGGGKTGTVDALVWALAAQARRSPLLRTIGVRTVWAIDRRILVDEVHEHASCLAARLADAATDEHDPLHDVARTLQELTADGSPPLVATRWRGGLAIGSPAHHPLQPEIITSTVAQVGSRLLFRGYGVGRRSLAVQAALTAVDTTVCLDEAHLAEPFRQTVEAIIDARRAEELALPPLHLITLTATPSATLDAADVLRITDADRVPLGPRLTGEKTARLVEPASAKAADRRDALLAAVDQHLADGVGSVACVVNSVRTAVDVHRALDKRFPDAARMILIGPQRPADRAQLLDRHRNVLFHRGHATKPLVVVATQTFEVGLDADVEALVTESASASALTQRLGRLNRAGERQGAATIVRDTESALYTEEEPAAWAWLQSLVRPDGTIDVSVDAVTHAPGKPAPVPGPTPPALTEDVLDRLVQTEPRPATMDDPDIDVFLRGSEAEPSADVMIAWRSDLRDEDRDEEGRAYREALLRLAPPQPEELVTVGIAQAHALLATLRADPSARTRLDGADLEGTDEPSASVKTQAGERGFVHVLLRGDEHFESTPDCWEPPKPGDVLVLPSWVGGYRERAVDYASQAPVEDVGPDRLAAQQAKDAAQPMTAPPRFWRLNDGLWDTIDADPKTRMRLFAAADAADRGDAEATTVARLLAKALGVEADHLGLGDGVSLDVRRVTPVRDMFAGDTGEELSDDQLLFLGVDSVTDGEHEDADFAMSDDERIQADAFVLVVRPRPDHDALRPRSTSSPTLEEHVLPVTARVVGYARRMELPAAFVATLQLAARVHDHGKAEPRTQAYFRGGSLGLGAEVIAKSVFGTDDRRAHRAASAASGMPRHLRHEVESVAILRSALATGDIDGAPEDLDLDLLLHIVGTHHGLGLPVPRLPHGGSPPRPYVARAAGIVGTGHGDGRAAWADGAWLEQFLTLNDRYGWWGLAYLRTLLMLADWTVSRDDVRGEPRPSEIPAVTAAAAGMDS